MVIISIMTVLMIPEMKGSYEESLLRSNGRKLSAAFSAAYSRAVTTHKLHRVRINKEDSKLLVEERSAEMEMPFIPVKQFDRRTSQLHPNVSIQFHRPTSAFTGPEERVESPQQEPEESKIPGGVFVFHPDGTCEGSDIELRDRMGFGLLLQLNGITSRVRFTHLERIQP